ncbi:MAG: prolipoprotein diacylglyceryl transferase [bacterium]|nr:prolipoprotein diacylglyceryl transferase [bacterium]
MIPYVEFTQFHLGPIPVNVWGFCVALGVLLAAIVAGWFVKREGGDPVKIYDLAFWVLLFGVIGARLGYILFYDLAMIWQRPLDIPAIWHGGMSIFGGAVAATIFTIWYLRRQQLDVWTYVGASVFGLPVGLWIGRIGCFLIHDHPGTATDFILGVEYPDGVVRHDHGLYLSLNGLLMAVVFFLLAKTPRKPAFYVAVFSVWYGALRFFLDFLRIAEVKYLGLLPSQYFGIALVLFGIGIFIRLNKKKL